MNQNFIKRTLTCILGTSLLIALIFLLPHHNFICLNLLVFALCFFGISEISAILSIKADIIVYSSVLIPICAFINPQMTEIALCLFILITMFKQVIKGESDDFENSNKTMSSELLIIIYPAYLISFFTRFTCLYNVNSYSVFLLLLLVFTNDTFAYIFGMLFGKNNNGIVKVSPKKSIAGFVGGTVVCIIVSIVYISIFSTKLPYFSAFGKFLLGLTASIFANAGDLAESVLKRSAKIKDSGNLIPGRGGVLDSIDSILTVSALFYTIFRFLR